MLSTKEADEKATIAFWAYLIDTLTPVELKRALLIRLGAEDYSLKRKEVVEQ